MDKISLAEFVKTNNSELGEQFQELMGVIAKTAKSINDKLSNNGLIEEQGYTGGKNVDVSVKLPFDPELTKDESEKLEADLHYAIEKVLAPLFK